MSPEGHTCTVFPPYFTRDLLPRPVCLCPRSYMIFPLHGRASPSSLPGYWSSSSSVCRVAAASGDDSRCFSFKNRDDAGAVSPQRSETSEIERENECRAGWVCVEEIPTQTLFIHQMLSDGDARRQVVCSRPNLKSLSLQQRFHITDTQVHPADLTLPQGDVHYRQKQGSNPAPLFPFMFIPNTPGWSGTIIWQG